MCQLFDSHGTKKSHQQKSIAFYFWYTLWNINMEPTDRPIEKEHHFLSTSIIWVQHVDFSKTLQCENSKKQPTWKRFLSLEPEEPGGGSNLMLTCMQHLVGFLILYSALHGLVIFRDSCKTYPHEWLSFMIHVRGKDTILMDPSWEFLFLFELQFFLQRKSKKVLQNYMNISCSW